MDSTGESWRTRRQQRLANRFGLLVVLFMVFSTIFATVGNVSPVAAAQPDCPDGEVLNEDTGECEPAGDAAQPDCAEDEVMNPFTGLCEPEGDPAPPDCAEDEVLNQETGECEPAGVPTEVTDDSIDDTTDDATDDGADDTTDGSMDDATDGGLEPQVEPVGMVDIYKYECPSGFSGENSSSDDFAAMCTEPMLNVGFAVYDLDEGVGGGTTGSDGYVGFSGLAAETHSVSEDVPIGYGTPYVFCASGADPSSLGGFEGYQVIDGYSVTIDFADINYYACSWYNIPEDGGGITITKYSCPEGYVSTDGQVSALRTNCVDRHDGVVFDLSNEAGYAESGETGDDSPGTLVFNDLEPGSYTLTEQVPAGYGTPYVLCGYAASPNDDGPPNTTVAAAAGGVWELEYTRPDRLDCEWFNIPSDSGIDIYKWLCPVDQYSTDTPYDTLLQDCTQVHDGVEFSLGNGTASYDSGLTGDDGPGRLTFEEYQPGTVVITETIPDGYGTPAVICSSQIYIEEPDGSVQYTSLPTDIMDVAADGSIVTQVAENRHYICNWFDFPGDYDIIVYKYVCPAGYAPEAFGYGELLADCTADTLDGVVFHLGDQTQATGQVIPDGVAFAGYEPGELVIREEVPAGYLPYVFCGQSSGGVAWNQMTPEPMLLSLAEDGSITVNLPENSRLICYWYNVPTGDATTDGDVVPQDAPTGSIDIFKLECPAELSGESSNLRYFQQETPEVDGYIASCTEPMGGVTFEATADQGTIVGGGATEPGGYLNISELPLQQVAIVESIPDGYGPPRVFCFDDSAGEYVELAVTGYSITIDFSASNYSSCYWFNFNIPDEPTGSIDIFKLECPSGFTPNPFAVNESAAMCTEPMGGVNFEAYDVQGNLVGGGTTDSGGYVNIRELPLGRVSIVELNSDGYDGSEASVDGLPYVFCFNDSFGDYGQMFIIEGEFITIEVDFTATNYSSCYWLTIPTETAGPDTTLGVVDEEGEPGFIAGLTLQHYLCDPGFDPRLNQGNFALLQLCTGAGKPAFVYNIYVDQTLVESVGLQTAAGAWGEVFLPAAQQEPIPSGLITIVVDLPAGYVGARVNCVLSRTDDSSEEIEPNLINGASIMVNVGPGESLVCEWFNWMPTVTPTPDPGYAQIKIAKFVCASAFDPTLEPAASELLRGCREVGPGQEFTIQRGTDDATTEITDGTGELLVFDIPPTGVFAPTTYTVAERIPAGFGEPVVMCGEAGIGKTRATIINGNAVTIELSAPGMSIECDWINIPAD